MEEEEGEKDKRMLTHLLKYQAEHKAFFTALRWFRIALTVLMFIFSTWWAAVGFWLLSTLVCWCWYIQLAFRMRGKGGT